VLRVFGRRPTPPRPWPLRGPQGCALRGRVRRGFLAQARGSPTAPPLMGLGSTSCRPLSGLGFSGSPGDGIPETSGRSPCQDLPKASSPGQSKAGGAGQPHACMRKGLRPQPRDASASRPAPAGRAWAEWVDAWNSEARSVSSAPLRARRTGCLLAPSVTKGRNRVVPVIRSICTSPPGPLPPSPGRRPPPPPGPAPGGSGGAGRPARRGPAAGPRASPSRPRRRRPGGGW